MSVSPISFPSLDSITSMNLEPTDVSGMGGVQGLSNAASASGTSGTTAAGGSEFGNLVADGLDRLQGLTNKADNLSVQAATGNLSNIHDYTIAASEAQVATQLTVSVRNQALDAFNKILQMQV
jgi:flagellar hook-basal body complex protein FliE